MVAPKESRPLWRRESSLRGRGKRLVGWPAHAADDADRGLLTCLAEGIVREEALNEPSIEPGTHSEDVASGVVGIDHRHRNPERIRDRACGAAGMPGTERGSLVVWRNRVGRRPVDGRG